MQKQLHFTYMELHRIEHQFENVPHRHERQFQVTLPFRGTCYLQQERSERILKAGSGLILLPNDSHSLHIEPGGGLVILKIDRKNLYPDHWRGSSEPEPPAWHHLDPREIYADFLGSTAGIMSGAELDPLAASEIEADLLAHVHRLLWGVFPSAGRKECGSNLHMGRVLEYMQAYYAEPLSIERLAAIALQSRYHFMRSFKTATGMTPYQYLLQLRIEKAKDELLRTDDTITDISFRLGFSSTSQFYRAFVKFVKAAPEQFRLAGRF